MSRTIAVDPRAMPFVGRHDYRLTLPLAPGEVVLTFDDGPRPATTHQVLKALNDECLRATFFVVGRQARAYPQTVRYLRAAGHTVGTHSQNHPMRRLSPGRTAQEIDVGIASVRSALGTEPAPFFRFPGLYRSRAGEDHLRRRGLMAWSVDVDSLDYKRVTPADVLRQTMAGLQRRRGGILLMHDTQSKTAQMLPALLANLKARGFRIVHVVPKGV
ncbi:MAG: polysaccharide deacetylase family protein, partial [Pseudolabrys sp.]|nr:polysaccharide deacetylase family protein [Pseudolabrys sp.]